jgi:hypothetical protein
MISEIPFHKYQSADEVSKHMDGLGSVVSDALASNTNLGN